MNLRINKKDIYHLMGILLMILSGMFAAIVSVLWSRGMILDKIYLVIIWIFCMGLGFVFAHLYDKEVEKKRIGG